MTAVGHGTTVATNAVIEETTAPTALVTTEGFRDVLAIGRQDRPALYDLAAEADVVLQKSLREGFALTVSESPDNRFTGRVHLRSYSDQGSV